MNDEEMVSLLIDTALDKVIDLSKDAAQGSESISLEHLAQIVVLLKKSHKGN